MTTSDYPLCVRSGVAHVTFTLDKRGRTTIPVEVRRELRLRRGVRLGWNVETGGTIIVRSKNGLAAAGTKVLKKGRLDRQS